VPGGSTGRAPSPGGALSTVDATEVTTAAGRLWVSKTLPSLQVACRPAQGETSASPAQVWLAVDGAPVPGTLLTSVPNTVLRAVTLSGVTSASLPAGAHTVSVVVRCDPSLAGVTVFGAGNATVLVLGG
jgi:hypothetical protein